MATQLQFPAPAAMPAVALILARYQRPQLEAFLSIALDLLDTMDGDGDAEDDAPEANGDEEDGSMGEDDFCEHNAGTDPGPGCKLSDADVAADDIGCDDINDDREEESGLVPSYGVDQSAGPLPPNFWGLST
ncbi:MAG: hypothetical protein ABIT09_01240 [Croceibacterium sp.]